MDQALEQQPPDLFGSCPRCEANWDGGDIVENLKKIQLLCGLKEQDLINIATNCYGYAYRKNFTKTLRWVNEDKGFNAIYCPNCGWAYDEASGKNYNHIADIIKIIRNEVPR